MIQGALVVAHVTTVHPRDDIRIFRKECLSLVQAGYKVVQIVGDGRGDAVVDDVQIVDIGAAPRGRLARMRIQPQRALEAIRRLRPALVHFHDPELLSIGGRLMRDGVPVIYDAHEDVPRQILTKQWIARPLRLLISKAFELYENLQVGKLSAVVAATPHIARRFEFLTTRCVNVSNFPFLHELAPAGAVSARGLCVCYVGGIMRTRGALEMIRALPLVPEVRLLLCGRFEDERLEAELRAEHGWAQVDFFGQVGREEVRDVLARSFAGLVTLLPMPSYQDSLPIKMFEYMSAELPVIASNFPIWREILERHECGLCVDPSAPEQIADAIRLLAFAPANAQAMGMRGRSAVLSTFNWPQAERELLGLYRTLLA